jgi:hypothetical protein
VLFTIGFFIVYRFFADHILVPKLIGRAVEVPALVTVVAVLIVAALLGVSGALCDPGRGRGGPHPKEIWFPRLDEGQPAQQPTPEQSTRTRTSPPPSARAPDSGWCCGSRSEWVLDDHGYGIRR